MRLGVGKSLSQKNNGDIDGEGPNFLIMVGMWRGFSLAN